MAIQRGLNRPFRDDRKRGTPNRARAQNPNPERIQTPDLQPQARPTDNFVQPPPAQKDPSGLLAISRALGSLEPGLRSFAAGLESQRNDPEDSVTDAQEYLLTRSQAEIDRDIMEGNAGALANVHGQNVLGEHIANRTGRQLAQDIASGDIPLDQPIEDIFEARIQADLEKYGEDRAFKTTYLPRMNKYRDRILAQNAEEIGNLEQTRRRQVVFQNWHDSLDLENSDDPASVVFDSFSNNRNFLGLDFADQQNMALTLAKQKASSGDFETAEAILNYAREDGPVDGQTLLTDPKTAQGASALQGRINREMQKQANQTAAIRSEDLLRQEVYRAALNGESLESPRMVLGENGERKAIQPQQLQRWAGEEIMADVRRKAEEEDLTPEQIFDYEVAQFNTGSLAKHPTWFKTMDRGAATATTSNMSGENIPPAVESGYQLYRSLKDKAPTYLQYHVRDDTRKFYQQVDRVLERGADGDTDQEQVNSAVRTVVARQATDRSAATPDNRTIDRRSRQASRAVTSLDSGFFGRMLDGRVENESYLRKQVVERTQDIVADTGISPDDAAKQAANEVSEEHFQYRGQAIRRSNQVTKDFVPAADLALEKWAEENRDRMGDSDADDLALLPADQAGTFLVYNRKTDRTFANPDDYQTLKGMYEGYGEQRRQEAESAAQERSARSAAAQARREALRNPADDPSAEAQADASEEQANILLRRGGSPLGGDMEIEIQGSDDEPVDPNSDVEVQVTAEEPELDEDAPEKPKLVVRQRQVAEDFQDLEEMRQEAFSTQGRTRSLSAEQVQMRSAYYLRAAEVYQRQMALLKEEGLGDKAVKREYEAAKNGLQKSRRNLKGMIDNFSLDSEDFKKRGRQDVQTLLEDLGITFD